MLKAIISLIKPDPTALRERFMARYQGRTLIVHEGLSIGWVAELLKEAGGGGHFRFDARMPRTAKPTPIEWVVHQHILPHTLRCRYSSMMSAPCERISITWANPCGHRETSQCAGLPCGGRRSFGASGQ